MSLEERCFKKPKASSSPRGMSGIKVGFSVGDLFQSQGSGRTDDILCTFVVKYTSIRKCQIEKREM